MIQSFDRRRFLRSAVALGGAFGASFVPSVHAATNGRVLIGFQFPGGRNPLIDTLLAGLQGLYQPDLGLKPVVVPGASGALALDALLKSPADGSTTLVLPSGLLTLLPLTRHLTDDPTNHVQAVAGIGELCVAFIVGPAVPQTVRTVPDFIEWVRLNPQFSSYGVPGLGTAPHFVGREISRITGLTWKPVAYKGMPSLAADISSGTLAAALTALPNDGSESEFPGLRVLAVSSDQRWPDFPDVPTMIEAKVMTLPVVESLGLFFAAGTPASKTDELAAAVRQVAATPPMRKVMDFINMRPMPATPVSYEAQIAVERSNWLELARRADNGERS